MIAYDVNCCFCNPTGHELCRCARVCDDHRSCRWPRQPEETDGVTS